MSEGWGEGSGWGRAGGRGRRARACLAVVVGKRRRVLVGGAGVFVGHGE